MTRNQGISNQTRRAFLVAGIHEDGARSGTRMPYADSPSFVLITGVWLSLDRKAKVAGVKACSTSCSWLLPKGPAFLRSRKYSGCLVTKDLDYAALQGGLSLESPAPSRLRSSQNLRSTSRARGETEARRAERNV